MVGILKYDDHHINPAKIRRARKIEGIL